MPQRQRPVDRDPRIAVIQRFIDEKVTDDYLERLGANVVGIGERQNGATTEPCLMVYVDPDEPHQESIGESIRYNDSGREVVIPVEVVVSKGLRFNAGPDRIPGGVGFSVKGNNEFPPATATLGGWVWDNDDDSAVVISNFHAMGDQAGRIIFQPTVPMTDRLGAVKRGTRKLNGKQTVDCAVAALDDPSRAQFRVLQIGPAVMRIGFPEPHMPVQKTGKATQRTFGKVASIGSRARVKDLAGVSHSFSNCIFIEPEPTNPWAEVTDSGALVFDREGVPGRPGTFTVVGLHFGNTLENPSRGIACEIDDVFAALNLSPLPEGLLHNVAKRVSGPNANTTAAVMVEFKDRLPTSELGSRLLNVLDAQQEEVVTMLAADVELRNVAVAVIQAVFGRAETVDDVLQRRIALEAIGFRELTDRMMQQSSDELRLAIQAVVQDIPDGATPVTIGALLRPRVA